MWCHPYSLSPSLTRMHRRLYVISHHQVTSLTRIYTCSPRRYANLLRCGLLLLSSDTYVQARDGYPLHDRELRCLAHARGDAVVREALLERLSLMGIREHPINRCAQHFHSNPCSLTPLAPCVIL